MLSTILDLNQYLQPISIFLLLKSNDVSVLSESDIIKFAKFKLLIENTNANI